MKTYIVFLLLLVLVGFLGWRWYLADQENLRLRAELNRMNEHAVNLEKDIVALHEQMQELKGKTVSGAVEDANEAIIKGWESFINRVQKELGEVREQLEKELNEPDQNDDSQSGNPPLSPKST